MIIKGIRGKIIQFQVETNYVYFLTDEGVLYEKKRFGDQEIKELIQT